MKPLQWVIIIFWIVVVGMFMKQCHDNMVHRDEVDAHTPKQFFFAPPPPAPKLHYTAAPSENADVQQVDFEIRDNTPSQGSFTCDVTLKNIGSKTATGVQIAVRPFRGAMSGNDNVGHTQYGILSDNDPLAQQTSWLSFPDLAPGEQKTESTVFLSQANVTPGKNPRPEIDFITAKDPGNP